MKPDDTLNDLIASIYDCAVDPEQWATTLERMRAMLDMAYMSLHFITFPRAYPVAPARSIVLHTDWDETLFDALAPLISEIPSFEQMRSADIDHPVTQMQLIDEREFHATPFYDAWVAPQGLRDAANTNLIRRDNMAAMLSGATFQSRDLISAREVTVLRLLAPHLRRALLISELLDETLTRTQMYRQIVETMSFPVLLVEQDGTLAFANGTADALLSQGTCLSARMGKLAATSPAHAKPFALAIHNACTGRDADIGLWGNGVVLHGSDGTSCVAYVLPMGRSERRHALGPGMAAVFVTSDSSARPPAVEVLTALSGLTVAEARVALAVADGQSVDMIAAATRVAPSTVRKQLSHVFDKTGQRSQASLAAFVNRLQVPVRRLPGAPDPDSAP